MATSPFNHKIQLKDVRLGDILQWNNNAPNYIVTEVVGDQVHLRYSTALSDGMTLVLISESSYSQIILVGVDAALRAEYLEKEKERIEKELASYKHSATRRQICLES